MARRPAPAIRRGRSSRAGSGRTRLVTLLGLLALIAFGIYASSGETSSNEISSDEITAPIDAPNPDAGSDPIVVGEPGSAVELLDTIKVKGKAPRTGYDREAKFGAAWIDVDGNGCDTRNDILTRDLTQIVFGDDCRVLRGVVDDPYTGESISFVRGEATSSLVQIDHVVALSNAWQTGAQQFSEQTRVAFANDPLNLLAVDGESNSQKGDGDTATWLPSDSSFRCEYVARQISVKAAYQLWVTAAERDAMYRVLTECPGQPALAE
ncbi:uncharacterized protein DUF1524 [Glaciihabitans tibetensis]|uniref:Uncharacterized protein DUF1524 n=1 Tax=Glaciihabitans tibetensis TaxID=1266600 RepID=A0A2T0VJM1_9MICO|nr:HNH endonuclease family protein [Glaciihabitans tibetensis]PRY70412.1 uncharacterized protein DUF1524 [Glaciihabitans tibetensis]